MKKPSMQPKVTSNGVWPSTSFAGKYSISPFSCNTLPISLSFLPCMPLLRRTPAASRTVTIRKQKARMNVSEFKPSLRPIEVAKDATKALWLEGKPPVLHMRLSRTPNVLWILPYKTLMIVLINWAQNQLKIHERNTGFVNKSLKFTEFIV